ncbi:hypothetical protein ACVIHI_009128 [Bradyrhizobium sp. USDA 4524]|uniref:hypothetical protein n=1 Tax=unclassified Bradyrhizobium TaxID=2631580 RepID=UPI00209FB88D|nr:MULTISPECIES: hypothetical protein [unclassified Bradyrhizobium]MCP1846093.1 hypothetical protein [Bradyrhizobium sp. USDA 4538]MCP1907273.1 hypothetical protein [Bradyrhizobium sp. USDA 4537]MCP1985748.1 hypothetical protein [Bradyrhizobium sp. USDA 4539]
MIISCDFDAAPSSHIAVSQVQNLLNIRSRRIAAQILSNDFLRAVLHDRLYPQLEPLPQDTPPASAALFNLIVTGPDALLEDLSRKMALLINHQAVFGTTDGAILEQIIDWCGRKDLIDIVRRQDGLPVFQGFGVFTSVTLEALDLYAQKVRQYLFGILPCAYAQRFRLRFAAEDLPPIATFAPDDPDSTTFLEYALSAHSLLER